MDPIPPLQVLRVEGAGNQKVAVTFSAAILSYSSFDPSKFKVGIGTATQPCSGIDSTMCVNIENDTIVLTYDSPLGTGDGMWSFEFDFGGLTFIVGSDII